MSIRIFKQGEQYFVFDPEDIFALHCKYRVLGHLVGSHAFGVQQLHLWSSPMLLSASEVALAVSEGFAHVVDDVNVNEKVPSDEDLKLHSRAVELDASYQAELLHCRKVLRERKFRSLNSSSKRKKSKKDSSEEAVAEQPVATATTTTAAAAAAAAAATMTAPATAPVTTPVQPAVKKQKLDRPVTAESSVTIPPGAIQSSEVSSSASSLVRITPDWPPVVTGGDPLTPLSHFVLVPTAEREAWFAAQEATVLDANLAVPVPTDSAISAARAFVYADLHRRGFFLSSGSKFGGDFLAYEGDPLLHHARYIVHVVLGSSTINALDFIAFGRLAGSVRKSGIIACVQENRVIRYNVIDWRGNMG